ncbi:MAG TPA: tRNA (adenosine(37)-N6)-threonylcarbamoyltransferase complex dimerization subunit type 1 TsaB [Candidatus Saccharibacteria bacterium]|nr:tRNA (adenosine(37)-N6)-threonylcarbamoyltransferase complex dimerization subunit type 1 TsaB [Candidatus Saccharibacteria bacterium]
MKLFLHSGTPVFYVSVIQDEKRHDYEFEAGRQLAKNIFTYIDESLQAHDAKLHDITGIGVYQGPGSFTGLRIGITVANTLAESLDVPIVGVSNNDDWQLALLELLEAGESHRIVMPEYGGDAHITQPRK